MKPSEDIKKEIYGFYLLIYKSSFHHDKKCTLMTSALAYEPWSWRVVGITEDTIRAIVKSDLKKPPRKLSRDHYFQKRRDTYNRMLTGELMLYENWWPYFWENDRTILMTNEEHKKVGKGLKISWIIDIDWELGYFQNSNLIGWKHTKKREGKFVQSLYDDFLKNI